MKRLSVLIMTIVWILGTYAQTPKTIDWKSDLDFLAKELPAKHYNFFSIRSQAEFLAEIEAIKAEAGKRTDFQTALKTQQLIATFGDSHTMLQFPQLIDRSQVVPLVAFWTSDGLHIVNTTPENKELLGQQIVAINNIPIATVIDSLSTLFTIDNRAVVKSIVPELLPCLQILEYFGIADSGQMELTLPEGKTRLLKPINSSSTFVSFQPDSLAFSTANRNVLFTDRYFPEERIYYMLYNKCYSKELAAANGNREAAEKLPSFEAFAQKAFETLDNKPIDKLVFDMRYNGGGNSSQGTAFVERLSQLLKKHDKMQVYVVLGRNTFSSAILNAMDFKRLTNAVFVGEETAGKPNHFGEVRGFQLPESKLQVNYSTKYFKRTNKELNTITPDVSIETSFLDYTKGIDPIYEWIKSQTLANRRN